MNEWVGKSLGKVRIDSLLARGGMAEVYLGVHTTLQREVAIKILRNQYEDDQELLERFQREARVVAKLRHQNIVQVFDYDAVDDHPYIVMEYVSGPSLSQYLGALNKKAGRLELPEISRILTSVANALQYAHKSGVIHRDVKPGNIILTSHDNQIIPGEPLPLDFQTVLTDFGLVRFLNSSIQTSAGQTAGTPAYMSPEQARGETTDARTDIYSLGIVLYEMLTGNVPFDGETTMSILLKHISEPPAPIQGLSYPLQRVLDRALAKNTSDRYQTANQFSNAFNAVLSGHAEAETEQGAFMGIASIKDMVPGQVSDPDPSLRVIDIPRSQRRRWRPIILGAIALTLLGVIYLINGSVSSSVNETPTPTVTFFDTVTPPSQSFVSTLGRTAVLYHRDGDAIMDQAFLEAVAMPGPPAGSQYEVWLSGPTGRLSLGVLLLDGTGKGTRTFNASQAENLLGLYDTVEIVIKPDTDANPEEIERVAYSYTLPKDGLVYVRQLLVANPDTPDRMALIQSLSNNSKALVHGSKNMLTAFSNKDQSTAKIFAESIINIIAGSQSPDHKDWNGDGQGTDPGNGYGFLLNGSNLGDIQSIYSHADYAANSPDASQNMIIHGAEVKACAENLAQWLPQLKALAQKIISAVSLTEMETPVKDVAALVDQIYNGIDLNGNGIIEPLTGECGVVNTYKSAYAMADMPLLPVDLLGTPGAGTPSPIVIFSNITFTPTKSSGGSGGAANTPVPPQPTSKGNGNGGGNGGGNGNGNGGGKKTPKGP